MKEILIIEQYTLLQNTQFSKFSICNNRNQSEYAVAGALALISCTTG
jgi:hypothetical protein